MDMFVTELYLLFQLLLYVGSEKHLCMKTLIEVFRFPRSFVGLHYILLQKQLGVADLVAGGGEVLCMPRKPLDANLQLMLLRFKWVFRGSFSLMGPLSPAPTTVWVSPSSPTPPLYAPATRHRIRAVLHIQTIFPMEDQKSQCARGRKQVETSYHLCPGPRQ